MNSSPHTPADVTNVLAAAAVAPHVTTTTALAARQLAFGGEEPSAAAKRVNCNEEDAERWDGLA